MSGAALGLAAIAAAPKERAASYHQRPGAVALSEFGSEFFCGQAMNGPRGGRPAFPPNFEFGGTSDLRAGGSLACGRGALGDPTVLFAKCVDLDRNGPDLAIEVVDQGDERIDATARIFP